MWRIECSAISSVASAAVSSASSDSTPRVITVLTGAVSGTSGRITRPIRSVRVRMPASRSPPAASPSTTMIDPTCDWCMRPNASRNGVSGAQVSGLRARTRSRSAVFMVRSALASDAYVACSCWRDMSSSAPSRRLQKSRNGPLICASCSKRARGSIRQNVSVTER